jgi:hypothetical protein
MLLDHQAANPMAPSSALTMSGQFHFLMRVGRTPRAPLPDCRPGTIQQPHTVQCGSSADRNGKDYEQLFHGSVFYANAASRS